jgi:energy-coupling factor transporter ATP-binding protein EcfA2
VIDYNNRLLIVGRTRSGKSELLNIHASALRSQWVLIDPKDEFAIPDVEKVHDVDALDFAGERILHWVPPTEPDAWEHFFGRVLALRQADPPGRFTVVLHEAGYSCQFKPNAVGPPRR